MKRRGQLLVSACLAIFAGIVPAAAATPEGAVLAQDLINVRASNKVAAAIWTHRPDSCTLQVVLAQSVCQRMMATAPAARATVTHQDAEAAERSSNFIGNVITNLRGLDPAFGACTLTLVDGRRSVGGGSAPAPTGPTEPAPVKALAAAPPGDPPRVQVWLLRADGTQITPYAVSAESPTARGCGSVCLTNEILYRFPLMESAQATAIAISIDDKYYIEKLRRLE